MRNSEPILKVDNLQISVNSTGDKLVKDISFDIGRRKTLGIVGESGSGKSLTSLSLMNLLHKGLDFKASGIRFNSVRTGKSYDLLQVNDRTYRSIRGKEIAMIFQEPMTALNPAYTCGDQVSEMIRQHNDLRPAEARTLTLDWMSKVKLPDPEKAYKSYPHQLSGGQRQRVMIAMAMCCEPSLLIADEPTTALDVTVQRTIVELMMELKEEYEMSILFITHDLALISEVADDILVMKEGDLMEYGEKKNLLSDPKTEYTKGLLACRPRLDKSYDRLPTLNSIKAKSTETESKGNQVGNKPLSDKIVLETKNLNAHYPIGVNFFGKPNAFYHAIRDINLAIREGETLGLVGESGCGKSTLGRTILQLVEHQTGDVLFRGNKVDLSNPAFKRQFRKQVQIIFQDPYSSLNPKMKTGKMLEEVLKVHSSRSSRSDIYKESVDLLKKVGLSEGDHGKYPHEFSGGQRQRIGIARALATKPSIIICDESVSALDTSVQAIVLNLLNDLKEELDLTYLFISHDLSVVKHMSDRIAVMKEGRIVELNEAENIYSDPKEEYTKNLLESIPQFDFL